jgi:hypothetical protein
MASAGPGQNADEDDFFSDMDDDTEEDFFADMEEAEPKKTTSP